MKAAVLAGYAKNGCDLELRELPIPKAAPGEVLLKVHAAGVNPLDNMIVRGEVKLIVPCRFPMVMGNELVGTVVELGAGSSRFAVGDRVYGRMPLSKIGAFSEYASVNEFALAQVPEYLSDEEAACVPLAALTALQSLEIMDAKAGDTIFVAGGTGSLGAMAVPIAAGLGLNVITNGNGASEQRMRALGAAAFIDYRKKDYAGVLQDIDYILDTLGEHELGKEFSVLKHGGTLVSLRGMPNAEFAQRSGFPLLKCLAFGMVGHKYDKMAARRSQRYRFVFVHEDGAGLEKLPEILGDRRIEASVDMVFPFDEVNAAMAKVAAGRSKGKTVLKIC